MERIIIDMDEVIADPLAEIANWYERAHDIKVNYANIKGGTWMGGFPEQHHQLVREKLFAEGFFRNLPVMDDAVDVLKEMNKRYEIYIVSAAVEFPNSLKDKHDWLLENFPYFTWKQLVLCGDKKMITGDYMIDDHLKNLIHFKGKPLLYSALHNSDVEGYERINNWKEAADMFLK